MGDFSRSATCWPDLDSMHALIWRGCCCLKPRAANLVLTCTWQVCYGLSSCVIIEPLSCSGWMALIVLIHVPSEGVFSLQRAIYQFYSVAAFLP